MKHFGDITKLSGYELPIVDVITGGSPCQDLSVAGKTTDGQREGLNGERSGLFLEQVRIVREMREHDRSTGRPDEYLRPRHMVWENVEGALSSPGKDHAGEDFQIVLTEIVKIVKSDALPVPLPEGGRWPRAGCIMGYGDNGCPFSIAWRLHDAQFWGATQYVDGRVLTRGTPQRRKRIALVADFNGVGAADLLFERQGLHGNPQTGGEQGKDPAADSETGAGESDSG